MIKKSQKETGLLYFSTFYYQKHKKGLKKHIAYDYQISNGFLTNYLILVSLLPIDNLLIQVYEK